MKITQHTVVTMHMAVETEDGVEIDSSFNKQPMQIIQGSHYLIDGLEKAIEGKEAGDTLSITVPPEEAYGERNDALTQAVPKSMFEGIDVQPGMQFRAQTDDSEQSVIVLDVSDEEVIVDGNHPLAGLTLQFKVEIISLRTATEEEIATGEVSKASCCDDDSCSNKNN